MAKVIKTLKDCWASIELKVNEETNEAYYLTLETSLNYETTEDWKIKKVLFVTYNIQDFEGYVYTNGIMKVAQEHFDFYFSHLKNFTVKYLWSFADLELEILENVWEEFFDDYKYNINELLLNN